MRILWLLVIAASVAATSATWNFDWSEYLRDAMKSVEKKDNDSKFSWYKSRNRSGGHDDDDDDDDKNNSRYHGKSGERRDDDDDDDVRKYYRKKHRDQKYRDLKKYDRYCKYDDYNRKYKKGGKKYGKYHSDKYSKKRKYPKYKRHDDKERDREREDPPAQPDPLPCPDLKLEVCVLVDVTGSVKADGFDAQQEAIKELARNLPIGDDGVRFAVMTYAEKAKLEIKLKESKSYKDLWYEVDKLKYKSGSYSDAEEAFEKARKYCFKYARKDVPRAVVFITDGQPNKKKSGKYFDNTDDAKDEAQKLIDDGVHIYSVGIDYLLDDDTDFQVDNPVQDAFLSAISKQYWIRGSWDDLMELPPDLIKYLCGNPDPERCPKGADICIAVDKSSSLNEENLADEREFVKLLAQEFNIGPLDDQVQIGIIVFNRDAQHTLDLDAAGDEATLLPLIDSSIGTNPRWETNMRKALDLMLNSCFVKGRREKLPGIGLLLTDGLPNEREIQGVGTPEERQNVLDNAQALKDAGYPLITLGIGSAFNDPVNIDFLKEVASTPGDAFLVGDFNALLGIKNKIGNKICDNTNPNICPKPADICVALDSSGSVGSSGFQKGLQFLIDLTAKFIISPDASIGGVQFGVVRFATTASNEVLLKDGTDAQALTDKINKIQYTRGFTNMRDALYMINDDCFNANNGDRADVDDIVLIITDGKPNQRGSDGKAIDDDAAAIAAAQVVKDGGGGRPVIVIGIGSNTDEAVLQQLSSGPYFSVDSFDALDEIKNTVGQEICDEIVPDVCPIPVDLCFIVDRSVSVDSSEFDQKLQFLRDITNNWLIGPDFTKGESQFGIVLFNQHAQLVFKLNQSTNRAAVLAGIDALENTQLGGATDIENAFDFTRENCFEPINGDRVNVKNLVIFISDHLVNDPDIPGTMTPEEIANAEDAARRMRQQEAKIISIGVGVEYGPDQEALADAFAAMYPHFSIEDTSLLDDIKEKVGQIACDELEEEEPCPEPADICILVDTSTSIGPKPFDANIRPFLQAIPAKFDVGDGPTQTQFGLVTFDDNAVFRFALNQYLTEPELLQALKDFPKDGGFTNTPEGLKVIRDQCFNAANGDRPDARNILLFITDGIPQLTIDTDDAIAMQLRTESFAIADQLKANGVSIVAIGTGNAVDEDFLRDISSQPQEQGVNWFKFPNFQALKDIADALNDAVCEAPDPVELKTCYVYKYGAKGYGGESVEQPGISSKTHCGALCSADKECIGFTYLYERKSKGKKYTKCFLHYGEGVVAKPCDKYDYSVFARKAPCEHDCFTRSKNYKLSGANYSPTYLDDVLSPYECAKACITAGPSCTHFEYNYQLSEGCSLWLLNYLPAKLPKPKNDAYYRDVNCIPKDFKYNVCFNRRPGAFGKGGEIQYHIKDLQGCREACAFDYGCTGFTMSRYDKKCNGPMCKLHYDFIEAASDYENPSDLYRKAPCTCEDCFDHYQERIISDFFPSEAKQEDVGSPYHCSVRCLKEPGECKAFVFVRLGADAGCYLYYGDALAEKDLDVDESYHQSRAYADLYVRRIDCELDFSMISAKDEIILAQCFDELSILDNKMEQITYRRQKDDDDDKDDDKPYKKNKKYKYKKKYAKYFKKYSKGHYKCNKKGKYKGYKYSSKKSKYSKRYKYYKNKSGNKSG